MAREEAADTQEDMVEEKERERKETRGDETIV